MFKMVGGSRIVKYFRTFLFYNIQTIESLISAKKWKEPMTVLLIRPVTSFQLCL